MCYLLNRICVFSSLNQLSYIYFSTWEKIYDNLFYMYPSPFTLIFAFKSLESHYVPIPWNLYLSPRPLSPARLVTLFFSELTQPSVHFLQHITTCMCLGYLCMSHSSYKITVSLKTEILFLFILPTWLAWCFVCGEGSVTIVDLNG